MAHGGSCQSVAKLQLCATTMKLTGADRQTDGDRQMDRQTSKYFCLQSTPCGYSKVVSWAEKTSKKWLNSAINKIGHFLPLFGRFLSPG